MGAYLIYVTVGQREEALLIARTLVEERLVACVNVQAPICSFYRWEGKVQEDTEHALLAKTEERNVQAVIDRVNSLHSYTCPCVVAWPIERGNPAFLAWIDAESR